MSLKNDPNHYDAFYFAHCCGNPYERNEGWLQFFGSIAQNIALGIKPRTVLDAGCAMGFLVEELRNRAIEAFGIDLSQYAIDRVRADLRQYCRVGSILDPLPQRYDLIVSIEVLEHIPAAQCHNAIAQLCQATDDVLFSSTPYDYQEPTHLNVQPPEYWAELFAMHGFVRDLDFDASFITAWAMRFRRNHEPLHRVVRDYERRVWTLTRECHDLRLATIKMRDQLAEATRQGAELVGERTLPDTP